MKSPGRKARRAGVKMLLINKSASIEENVYSERGRGEREGQDKEVFQGQVFAYYSGRVGGTWAFQHKRTLKGDTNLFHQSRGTVWNLEPERHCGAA